VSVAVLLGLQGLASVSGSESVYRESDPRHRQHPRLAGDGVELVLDGLHLGI